MAVGTRVIAPGQVLHQPPNGLPAYTDYAPYISIWEMGALGAVSLPGQTAVTVAGNGVTDDSAAINAAIAALAGTGKTLVLESGIFLCSANAIVNSSQVPIMVGPTAQITGTNASQLMGFTSASSLPYRARFVYTTNTSSTTYTGSGTNTLTMGSNGAMASQDGVTPAVGDTFILASATLNGGTLTITAKDCGPWVVSSLGSAGTPQVFVRPQWWQTGATMPVLPRITVGPEGTLFGATEWTVWASAGTVIGTTDPSIFPDRVLTQGALSTGSGTLVLTTVPLRSATKTLVIPTISAVSGTNTAGVTVQPLVITPGYTPTSSVTIQTLASAFAANAVASTNTLNVLIVNR